MEKNAALKKIAVTLEVLVELLKPIGACHGNYWIILTTTIKIILMIIKSLKPNTTRGEQTKPPQSPF
jgi:hypothetical protein